MDTTASVGSTPAVARERLRLDGFFHVEGVYHDMTEDDAEIKLTQVSEFVGNLCKFLELVFA